MTYSPFRSFRKHQKTYFAALTILCMFVFVLTGISGNMQELMQFVGGPSKGQIAATIDGKKITLPQINEVRVMRETASLFMQAAHQRLDDKLVSEIRSQLTVLDTKLDPSTRQVIQQALFYHGLARQGYTDQQVFMALYSVAQQLNMALQQASLGRKANDEKV